MNITREEIKQMLLAAQGMSQPIDQPARPEDVLASIRQMGLLQIDTISVVARSPYFVLWSRLGDYDPAWLEESHREGQLFEYYAHAACFIPIEQYPLFRPDMGRTDFSWRHSDKYYREHQPLITSLLEHIRENGPVRSADFERDGSKSSGWWDWKEEKIALENLWSHGELMIAFRKGFQRYYDLTENVLPTFDQIKLSNHEALREKILGSVKYLGAARAAWIPDYYRMKKKETFDLLPELIAEKLLIPVHCADFGEDVYVHHENIELLQQVLAGHVSSQRTSILSPFDPIIWDRQRMQELFDFEFTIECYLPAAKRKYGYFSLPILHQSHLIGRVDIKAHRKMEQFEIKSLHLEPGVELSSQLAQSLSATLTSCSNWHRTPNIVFSADVPSTIRQHIEAHF